MFLWSNVANYPKIIPVTSSLLLSGAPGYSLGFLKQESQGHFLRKVGVSPCNFVKFS